MGVEQVVALAIYKHIQRKDPQLMDPLTHISYAGVAYRYASELPCSNVDRLFRLGLVITEGV